MQSVCLQNIGLIASLALLSAAMIFEHSSYRTFLKAALAEKSAENPKYSLRALANQLNLSPAILSQVMSSKRNFSLKTAYQVAQNLKLGPVESIYFCLLAQYEAEKHPALKSALHSQLEEVQKRQGVENGEVPRDLNVEMFKLISDWYHIPIIEMTELKDFEFSAEGISKRLGISRNEAEVAIERLERLELIEKKAEGGYRKTNNNYEFRSALMSEALNRYHSQMLIKATESMAGQARTERKIVSNTFSIDPSLLPKAEEIINKFRQEMVELFNTGTDNTETYHMGVQLFRLTQPEETEK